MSNKIKIQFETGWKETVTTERSESVNANNNAQDLCIFYDRNRQQDLLDRSWCQKYGQSLPPILTVYWSFSDKFTSNSTNANHCSNQHFQDAMIGKYEKIDNKDEAAATYANAPLQFGPQTTNKVTTNDVDSIFKQGNTYV